MQQVTLGNTGIVISVPDGIAVTGAGIVVPPVVVPPVVVPPVGPITGQLPGDFYHDWGWPIQQKLPLDSPFNTNAICVRFQAKASGLHNAGSFKLYPVASNYALREVVVSRTPFPYLKDATRNVDTSAASGILRVFQGDTQPVIYFAVKNPDGSIASGIDLPAFNAGDVFYVNLRNRYNNADQSNGLDCQVKLEFNPQQ